jgi:uncharacterized protein YecT (DUF1311 family)
MLSRVSVVGHAKIPVMTRTSLSWPRWLAVPLLVAGLMAVPAAQANDQDPIDSALDACLASAKGQSTAGMVECTGTAIDAWNARLNANYKKVLASLDPKSREALRVAQRRWVAFRDAEKTSQSGPWTADRGSEIRVAVMGANLAAVKQRAEELLIYLP